MDLDSDIPAPLDRSIDELEISVRLYSALQSAGIVYLGELVQWSEPDLLKLPRLGRKELAELTTLLGHLELALGTDAQGWQRPDGAPLARP